MYSKQKPPPYLNHALSSMNGKEKLVKENEEIIPDKG